MLFLKSNQIMFSFNKRLKYKTQKQLYNNFA